MEVGTGGPRWPDPQPACRPPSVARPWPPSCPGLLQPTLLAGRFVILPPQASSGKIFEECSNYLRSAREASWGPLVQEVTPQIPGRAAPGPHAHPRLRPCQPLPQVGRSWPRTLQPQMAWKRLSTSSGAQQGPVGRVGGRGARWSQCSCLSNGTRMSSKSGVTLQTPWATITVPEPAPQGPHSLPLSDGSG